MNAGYNQQMALFQMPPVNAAIDNVRWVDISPTNSFSEGMPLEFTIHANPTSYIDLGRSMLYVQAKVLLEDGTSLPDVPIGPSIPDKAKVGPVNLWLHSMFTQVDVYLQQKLVTSSSTLYPYKAYIDTILKETYDSQRSQLESQLFYKDLGAGMDSADPQFGTNPGLSSREQYIRKSQSCDLQGKLKVDFFDTSHYLLNNIYSSNYGKANRRFILCQITPNLNIDIDHGC